MRWIYWAVILGITLEAEAQTRTNSVKKIRTLPIVKLGDTPSSVKGVQSLRIQPKPPKVDPYEWIVLPDTETNRTHWTLANGTHVAFALVKFNKYTAVFVSEDERERQIARSGLNQEGRQRLDEFEKRHLKEVIEDWKEQQEKKKDEKDLDPPR